MKDERLKRTVKPEICGCEDGTNYYRCPDCHDSLDYKQKECGWCHAVIDWTKDSYYPIDARTANTWDADTSNPIA